GRRPPDRRSTQAIREGDGLSPRRHEPRDEGDLLLGAVEAGDEARVERQGDARDHAGDDDGGDKRGPAGDAGLISAASAPPRRAPRAYSANGLQVTTDSGSAGVERGHVPPSNIPVPKSSVRPRLLNGQTGDPALLVTLRWQGRAVLIDLGRIDRTPGGVLLPIEAVFVSHAHMDHFMGF